MVIYCTYLYIYISIILWFSLCRISATESGFSYGRHLTTLAKDSSATDSPLYKYLKNTIPSEGTATKYSNFNCHFSVKSNKRFNIYLMYLGNKFRFEDTGCVAHVVSEHFKYEPRVHEENAVCELMHTRFQMRRNTSSPDDKMYNPLIAIPGSPGSGKSTFLANFANSKCYKSMLKMRYPGVDDPQPIVALYSFAGMEIREPELGLRILHGALASMGVWGNQPKRYGNFCDELLSSNYKINASIKAREVVPVLREFFGKDRPILLLQDETVSTGNTIREKSVIKQICGIMTNNGGVDLIVSALSPQYVDKLVTRNSTLCWGHCPMSIKLWQSVRRSGHCIYETDTRLPLEKLLIT